MSIKYHDVNVGVTLGGSGGGGGGILGFTRVAYLATLTGIHEGYIDTGVYPTSHHRVQATFALVANDGTAWYTIFGCRDGSLSRLTARYSLDTSTPPNSLGIQYSTDAGQPATIVELSSITKANSVLVFRKLEFNKNEVYVDGALVHTFTPPTGTASYPYTLYLFALNNAGTLRDQASCFISRCRIWDENDALVRDFVPAIRDSDGVAGMYNLVNGVFYTSPSGDFYIGPSIEEE